MKQPNDIRDELRALNSSLPANENPVPFSVPEGYFEGLAASVMDKIKTQEQSVADELQELSPLLASLPKEVPYQAPSGYFEENLAALPALLFAPGSALLDEIGKELPYTVPQGYFDTLPQQVLSSVAKPRAKVVPLFARTWMRAATAAVVGGLVLLGGYQLLNRSDDRAIAKQPATRVDTTALQVAQNNQPVVQDIKQVSTQELDDFIQTVPYNPAKLRRDVSQTADAKEVINLLKDVSEKDLDIFLDQLPTADESLSIID